MNDEAALLMNNEIDFKLDFCYNAKKAVYRLKENLIIDKSIAFSARIVKHHQHLVKSKKKTMISKQIVCRATSIGANINKAKGINK